MIITLLEGKDTIDSGAGVPSQRRLMALGRHGVWTWGNVLGLNTLFMKVSTERSCLDGFDRAQ